MNATSASSSPARARPRAPSPLPRAAALALALALACSGGDDGSGASGSTGGATEGSTGADTSGGEASTGTDTDAAAVCGDGVLDASERCDGPLLGDQSCAGLGAPYVGGALSCALECSALDATACDVDPSGPIVRLNEILARGADEGPYAGLGDVIEIVNAGGAAIDLAGWRLSDDPLLLDEKTYTFPASSKLLPGAFMVLVEYNDSVDVGDFPFGISSSKTETLTLVDAGDVIVDQVTFDGALADPSYCRLPDGGATWQTCVQTPGDANLGELPITCGDGLLGDGEACEGDDVGGATCQSIGRFTGGELGCSGLCTFDVSGCEPELTIVVNELSSSDADLIELYNAGDAAIDLSGWILTDDVTHPYDPATDLEAMIFADGASLDAGAFMVIEKGSGPGQHPFGLGGGGDSLRLFDADLKIVDAVTYGDQEAALAYCRLPDGPGGAWTSECVASFGGANQGP